MTLADTYIVFELNNSAYAVSSAHVRHVEMVEHVTPVPNTAAALDGVVFSRGQMIRKSIDGIGRVARAMDTSTTVMRELNKQTGEIGTIVGRSM